MKHIFFVHSHITYLSSLGVICHLDIPLSDVVIVSCNYRRDKPLLVHDINEFNKNSLISKVRTYFYPHQRSDSFIRDIVGEDVFTLYLGWNNIDQRFMMTHPKCKGVNFIEEGLSAYWNNMSIKEILFQRNPSQKIRSDLTIEGCAERLMDALTVFKGYNTAVQSLPNLYFQYCSDESVNYYGFDEKSFTLINRNKHVMKISDITNRFDFDEKPLPDNSIVYISDYNHSSHSSFNEYAQELDSLSNYLISRNIKKVYVKWHYKCNLSLCERMTDILKTQYSGNIEIIPTAIAMEIVFLKSKNLTVLGNASSLLFYSSIMGHHTFSFAKKKNLDFKAYWQKIKLVNDESQL